MIKPRFASVLFAPLWLMACVTINVYFPAAAAENAADRILEEVYGKPKAEDGQSPPGESKPESAPQSSGPDSVTEPGARLLNLVFIASAHAQSQANIDIDTPAIRAITASLSRRENQLRPFFDAGAIGMDSRGQIQIRDAGAVDLKERNRLRQLVAADNRDWNALYREVASANGHPEWEDEIRATFARRWVAKAPGGWWYQDGSGSWKRK